MPEVKSDHDLLIELNANSNLQFALLREDLKKITDGVSKTLADHQKEITDVKNDIARLKPVPVDAPSYGEVTLNQKLFNTRLNKIEEDAKYARFRDKFIISALVMAASFIGALLDRLATIFNLFGLK